jgi:hypothetical protein
LQRLQTTAAQRKPVPGQRLVEEIHPAAQTSSRAGKRQRAKRPRPPARPADAL